MDGLLFYFFIFFHSITPPVLRSSYLFSQDSPLRHRRSPPSPSFIPGSSTRSLPPRVPPPSVPGFSARSPPPGVSPLPPSRAPPSTSIPPPVIPPHSTTFSQRRRSSAPNPSPNPSKPSLLSPVKTPMHDLLAATPLLSLSPDPLKPSLSSLITPPYVTAHGFLPSSQSATPTWRIPPPSVSSSSELSPTPVHHRSPHPLAPASTTYSWRCHSSATLTSHPTSRSPPFPCPSSPPPSSSLNRDSYSPCHPRPHYRC